MTTKTKAMHSPTPWAVNGSSDIYSDAPDADELVVALGKVDPALFSDVPGRYEANMAHIVRCVNNHDALLAACRAAIAFLMPQIQDEEAEGREGVAIHLHDKIVAAIAAAEGDA